MNTASKTPWYRRVGPGLITACVVIGPGSIVTSSSVGANYGYSMLWIVIVAVVFQMTFMTLASRLGCIETHSMGDLIRERGRKDLAIAVGLSVFFISAAFQSGNNIGIAAVFESLFAGDQAQENNQFLISLLVILFNACAIIFLFAFRNLYQMVERMMMVLVALMLVSFAINMLTLAPKPTAVVSGFVPSFDKLGIDVLGLVGTTFVISAAFYQAYLVRQKGWSQKDVAAGSIDVRVGVSIMAIITIMLMVTAAAGLHDDSGHTVKLANPVEIAKALEPTFGSTGKLIFCMGLFSAAYSSFLINSMIGGFVLSDGLGLGCSATDRWPRIFTSMALLTGMAVALGVIIFGFDRTPTIIAANAVTIVGSPLVAIVLVWLCGKKELLGEHAAGTKLKCFAYLGVVLLLAMAARTALVTLPSSWKKYRSTSAQVSLLAQDNSAVEQTKD